MSVLKPYIELQMLPYVAGDLTYGTHASGANNIKVRKITLKRTKQQSASTAEVSFPNYSGAYNSIVAQDKPIEVYTGIAEDGSDKIKRFKGTIVRLRKFKRYNATSTVEVTCRDATFDLLNVMLKNVTVEPGGTTNGVVINDIADVVRAIMASPSYNPQNLTVTNVQNVGRNISFKRQWKYKPVLKALQEMAVLADYDLFVDPNNDLYFRPKNSTANSVALTTDGASPNVEGIEEDVDFEDEKDTVLAYCGSYSGTSVVASYSTGRTVNRSKATWKRDINIAPNATSLAEAKEMCKEFARRELDKMLIKHAYRLTLNQYIPANLGDIFTVTCADLGLNGEELQLIETEETFSPKEKFKGVYVLSEKVGVFGPQ